MALQLSTAVRNAMLDVIESTIAAGGEPRLLIYSGSPPANCAASATGTKLAEVVLASNFMATAGSGSKAKTGTWEDTSADATGTAGYFRLVSYTSYPVTAWDCHIQGTVTATGGGGDMEVTSVSFTSGQKFEVDTFTLAEAYA